MVSLTVVAIVLRSNDVLLAKREDFDVWCLPGGHVDPGESVCDAAVREVLEETGFPVRLVSFVGVYSAIGDWPDMHSCAFSAEVTGQRGDILTPEEVSDVSWFPLDALPEAMIWWHRRRIEDAAAGRAGLAVAQHIVSSLGRLERPQLYEERDKSGLTRSEFFLSAFPPS